MPELCPVGLQKERKKRSFATVNWQASQSRERLPLKCNFLYPRLGNHLKAILSPLSRSVASWFSSKKSINKLHFVFLFPAAVAERNTITLQENCDK